MPAVDVPAMAHDYLARLAAVDAAEAADLAPLGERVAALSARLAAICIAARPQPRRPDGQQPAGRRQPLLVDWEYAQVTEPTWDLACLLTYYPDMARFMTRLLAGAGLAGTARGCRAGTAAGAFRAAQPPLGAAGRARCWITGCRRRQNAGPATARGLSAPIMALIKVTDRDGIEHDVEGNTSFTLMENLRDLEYGVAAVCGGMCACATCHV